MKNPWRYWRFVRLTMKGTRQVEEVPLCRACLDEHFPGYDETAPPDAVVQRQLLTWAQAALPSTEFLAGSSVGSSKASRPTFSDPSLQPSPNESLQPSSSTSFQSPEPSVSLARLAEGCLRCVISQEIDRTCKDLLARFGRNAGLSRLEDLLLFVLTDADPLRQRPNTPLLHQDPTLAGKVLRTFNPDKAQLNTWTKRLVLSDRGLNLFFQEHGVYFDSDWSLLNSLTASRLCQLLTATYAPTPEQLHQAVAILQSYQAVYRRDRLASRTENRLASRTENRFADRSKAAGLPTSSTSSNRTRCEPPTPDQLVRMVEHLRTNGVLAVDADSILAQLDQWAELIRQARRPATVSLDVPGNETLVDRDLSDPSLSLEDQEWEVHQRAFLQKYRDALRMALDGAIAQTLSHRAARLAKRTPSQAAAFLEGLHRFHCGGESMGAIAPHIGLSEQYQVTRLLSIKQLRADIRRQTLLTLKECIGDLAQEYVEANRLQRLDANLEAILDGQLDPIFAAAEAESFTAQPSSRSLLTQRLCDYLTHPTDPL